MAEQTFRDAERKQLSFLAKAEKKTLIWMAHRMTGSTLPGRTAAVKRRALRWLKFNSGRRAGDRHPGGAIGMGAMLVCSALRHTIPLGWIARVEAGPERYHGKSLVAPQSTR
jgi:hypothetical protein